jgi:alpha-L-fucosidase
MFSDVGPDIRWVGNEKGVAGDPCWHTIDSGNAAPGDADQALLNSGSRSGGRWLPAECDVSIRPGWFYHESEDASVRSPENLLDLYFQSVGRGASLLLNLPPDRRGLVHERDCHSLETFRTRVDAIFSHNLLAGGHATASNTRGGSDRFGAENLIDGDSDTYWATDDSVHDAEVTIELPAAKSFNVVEIREYIALGQRIEEFAVDIETTGGWTEYARGRAVGNRRLIRGQDTTASRVRLRVFGGPASHAVSAFGLYSE